MNSINYALVCKDWFEVRPGETFVYPEGVVLPAVQTFDAGPILDVMREEIGRGVRSFNELRIINDDHPLLLGADSQIGVDAKSECLEG